MSNNEDFIEQVKDVCETFNQQMAQSIVDAVPYVALLGVVNKLHANAILVAKGYQEESYKTLSQWGVLECETDKQVEDIIQEVIEHRKTRAI